MRLLFQPDKIDRSITRERWKEMWRWKRVTERVLSKHEEQMIEAANQMATDAAIYGTSAMRMQMVRDQIMYEVINPPLLMGPTK